MSVGLTPKQRELLCFLTGFIGANGYSPCYREISTAIGVAGKGAVHRLLEELEERGAIRRMHGRPRAIEVLATPLPVSTAPDGAPLYFVAVAA